MASHQVSAARVQLRSPDPRPPLTLALILMLTLGLALISALTPPPNPKEQHPTPIPDPKAAPNPCRDFQIISLKLLAHQLLLGCPSDQGTRNKHLGTDSERQRHVDSRDIFLPGEVSRTKLAFPAPVLLFVSANNPGAKETAALLKEGMVGLSVTSVTPTQFSSGRRVTKASASGISQLVGPGRNLLKDLVAAIEACIGGTARASGAGAAGGEGNNVTHMLLYLNDETFVGPEGAVLADEVHKCSTLALALAQL